MADDKKKDPLSRLFDWTLYVITGLIAASIALTLLVKFLGFILVGLFLVVAIYLAVRFYRAYAQERRDHEAYRRTHP